MRFYIIKSVATVCLLCSEQPSLLHLRGVVDLLVRAASHLRNLRQAATAAASIPAAVGERMPRGTKNTKDPLLRENTKDPTLSRLGKPPVPLVLTPKESESLAVHPLSR